jgi:hypothetical protein
MSLKNPLTPLGIDAGTVRLVAQRLNHYAPSPSTSVFHHGYILVLHSSTTNAVESQQLIASFNETRFSLTVRRLYKNATDFAVHDKNKVWKIPDCTKICPFCEIFAMSGRQGVTNASNVELLLRPETV